jgi:DNA invertase Pin-like site-specific DNA recombinase
VIAWHTDHICSVTEIEGRAGLLAALTDLRTHGAGVLVVAKRDRIARDVVLAATIEREVAARGARIASVAGEGTEGNDPSSQLMRGISDLFAQHERAMIRARTTAALAAKKARGQRAGELPYGFAVGADGATLVPCEAEQGVIARVREAKARGVALRGIVMELERAGIVSRKGRPLQLTQVARIARGT